MQSAPPLRGDKEKDMKKQHRRFRWAFAPFALAAAAALAAFAAGCGSGLLDTEDKDESFYTKRVIVTSDGGLSGTYGMDGRAVRVAITVANGNFSREFMSRVNEATEAEPIDVTDYFTVTTGTATQLLQSYTFKAITPVANTLPDVGSTVSRGSGTFTAELSYKICGDDKLLEGGATSGAVKITASADVLDETTPLECAGSISYQFTVPEHELLSPTGSALYWAARTINDEKKPLEGLNAAVLLTTVFPVQKDFEQGEPIGTATGGALVYAAKAIQKGSGKIFAVVNNATAADSRYTGSVTITLYDDVIHPNEEKDYTTHDAATTLLVPLYGLDFDEAAVATEVVASPTLTPILVDDGAGGKALCENPKAAAVSGPRAAFTVNPEAPKTDPVWHISYKGASSYVVEFDLMLDGIVSDDGRNNYSHFYLYNAAPTYKINGGTFALNGSSNHEELTASPPSSEMRETSYVWHFTGEATWLTSGTMQHYKVYVNYNEAAGASTVTVEVDGKVVETNTAVNGNGDVQGVLLEPARGTAQTIDNIRIYYASK